MAVARHGDGPVAAARALASQVHPVFMLPPLAASLFGGILAGTFAVVPGALHVLAAFFGLYTAHVKDGYVDFYVRDEDDDHPLSPAGCRLAMWAATAAFGGCLVGLGLVVGPGAALVTAPGWLVAYFHAPQLDVNPVTATFGYPAGIALAVLGGYYVQATGFGPTVVAFAAVFLAILSGTKTIDDSVDYEYDASIDKRTMAVALGRERARLVAYGLVALGVLLVATFAVVDVFPPSTLAGVAVFSGIAVVAARAPAELATMILIRGSYVLMALLLAAVWFRPLG